MEKKYLIALLICACSIYSQPIKNRFTNFTEQEGLPSNGIQCLMQDHLGYIWIGTSNGIAKYDGYEFEKFNVVPNDTNFLQLPLTSFLFEDSNGNIWIGSIGGLTKYDRNKKTFKIFNLAEFDAIHDRTFFISDIVETDNGNILFSVIDFRYKNIKNGLHYIDLQTNKIDEVQVSNDDSTNAITQITPLGDDKYLISGEKGFGEYNLRQNTIHWYPLKKEILVLCFIKEDNYVWLGTYNDGLLRYNLKDSTYTSYPAFDKLFKIFGSFYLGSIIYDTKKNLLFATNKGLLYFDVRTKEIAISEIDSKNPSSMHSLNLTNILMDNSGSIWIGSSDAGMSKYDIVKNNFHAFTRKVDDPNSITTGWVGTIFEYNTDELWLKTNAGTIVKFNPNEETFERKLLPKDFEVFDIIKSSKNEILLAGSNGVYKVDPIKWEFEKLKIPFNIENFVVYSELEVANKKFWFGTFNGIYIYDELNSGVTNINFKDLGIGTTGSNTVIVLEKDKRNNIWIGTDDGLFEYDNKTKIYSRIGLSKESAKSLTSQDINSIYIDKDDNLWIGTWLGGLCKYDKKTKTFESYTQKNGLKSHSIQGILGDEENGALWLSTFDGISRFDLKKKSFSNFGVDDGIHGNQFADGSAFKTSNGEFVFGGLNGITVFNPNSIQNNLIPPKVFITDIKLFNKSVIPDKKSLLRLPIYATKNLTLNYDENDIEFDYLAPHYVDPKKNQYAYKLENYETKWRYVGNQRSAIYPNLPPGKYVFHLRASNNNEVWNDTGVSLNIEIRPPWWRTWVAYLSYLLIGLGFLSAIRNFELKRQNKNAAIKESKLRAEAAELQAKVAETQSKVIQAENDRQTKELEEARELQLSMLPKELPEIENLEIAVYMQTATEVGGDYYDFRFGLDGTLNIAIGDATGHGLQAGTLVTIMKGIFTLEAENCDVLSFFHKSVKAIKEIKLGRLLMAFAFLKIRGNQLSLANAGVPPVYIFRKKKNELEEINNKGMPLGAMNNYPYKETKTELNNGDVIFLLSDGFPELTNKYKEPFGYERVKKTFNEVGEKSADEIIEHLKNVAKEWSGVNIPDDDVTFVVIKIK